MRARNNLAVAIGWLLFVAGVAFIAVYTLGAAFAYLLNASGIWKLAGLVSPVSGLLLPFFGRGEIAGIVVHSFLWWWLLIAAGVGLGFSAFGGPFQVVIQYEGRDDNTHWMSLARFDSLLMQVLQDNVPLSEYEIAGTIFGLMTMDNALAVSRAVRGLVKAGAVVATEDGEGAMRYSLR